VSSPFLQADRIPHPARSFEELHTCPSSTYSTPIGIQFSHADDVMLSDLGASSLARSSSRPSIFHLPASTLHRAFPSLNIPPRTTAKLSSPILLPRTVSYDASSNPPRPSGPYRTMSEQKTGRRRRSSSLLYQEPPETIEHMSDQAALPNLNANWVNAKGQSSQTSFKRCPVACNGRFDLQTVRISRYL